MIRLIEPEPKYLDSYLQALDQYRANGVNSYSFSDGRSMDIFEKFRRYKEERDLPPNRVGATYYWLVEEQEGLFIGEISIRHRLNDALRQYGGHIGYGVRYDRWNQGYGTQMLALALEKAKEMGLEGVLITCDRDNLPSARVMEHNGLVLIEEALVEVDGQAVPIRRYWKNLSAD